MRSPAFFPAAIAALAAALFTPAGAQANRPAPAPADPGLIVGLLAGALLLTLVLIAARGRRTGRTAGVVIPRFEPPAGVSATLAAYLTDRSVTSRVFTTAVAELAALGFVSVVGGPKPRIDRAPRPPEERPPLELRALLEALLPRRRPQIELGREHAAVLLLARSELGRNLARRAAPYLRSEPALALAGTALASLAIAAAAGLAYARLDAALLAGIFSYAYVFLAGSARRAAVLAWERYRLVPGLNPLGELLRAAGNLVFVFGAPLLGGLYLSLAAGAAAGALAAVLALVAVWAGERTSAFTPKGAEAWRHLLGLARYLGTTDERELRRLGAPEDAPETLRRLYPYAIALGVESAFAKRLDRYLDRFPENARTALLWDTGPESYPRMPGRHTYSLGVSRSLQNAYEQAGAYTPRIQPDDRR
ncbi:DUF2207 domain-containing protein [Oceanithermus sp.]|uniref:DUF2207 family protein n=1 Tax=Oceanithermus sp. TaxID=2268145 RepID=UPI002579F187|nr:DUF2207 domain-containing protein [Oceanithermus sp.]